jgi:hypothetical protein
MLTLSYRVCEGVAFVGLWGVLLAWTEIAAVLVGH